ncbi:hypothetical protein SARC_14874, partial [Sphaeroforma arctica JP610]
NTPMDMLALLCVTRFDEHKFPLGDLGRPVSPWVQWCNDNIDLQDKTLTKESAMKLRLLTSIFALRRTLEDSGIVMPEKKYDMRQLELSEEEANYYREYQIRCATKIEVFKKENRLEKQAICVFAMLTRLRQLCIHPWLVQYTGAT